MASVGQNISSGLNASFDVKIDFDDQFLNRIEFDILKVALDEALRTTARKTLLIVFRKRFADEHPGQTPYKVASSNVTCKGMMKRNKDFKSAVESDNDDKLDITSLYNLLKSICGFSKKDSVWNSHSTIEGNIQRLNNLRNKVFHRSKISKVELQQDWKTLVESIKQILELFDHSHLVDSFMTDLAVILDKDKKIADNVQRELLDMYSAKVKTSLAPILWAGQLYSFNRKIGKIYCQTLLSVKFNKIDTPATFNSFLSIVQSKICILEGESGTGKTSLLRYYCSVWRPKIENKVKELENYDYVILFESNIVQQNLDTLGDHISEALPNSVLNFKREDVMKVLCNAGSRVLFLIDAFDERKYLENCLKKFIAKFSLATFIICTRPHCTARIISIFSEEVTVAKILGFDLETAKSYIESLFRKTDNDGNEQCELFLSQIFKYPDIMSVPQLLCWSAYSWIEAKSKDLFDHKTQIYWDLTNCMLRKLCHINGKRIMSSTLPKNGLIWLEEISGLAYKLLMRNQMMISHEDKEFGALCKRAKELGFRNSDEALSTFMQSDSSMTGSGEILTFQFHHISHAEYLAAYYIVQNIINNSEQNQLKLDEFLESVNDNQILNVLEFIIGLLNLEKNETEVKAYSIITKFCKNIFTYSNIEPVLRLINACNFKDRIAKTLAKVLNSEKTHDSYNEKNETLVWIRKQNEDKCESLELFLKHYSPKSIWLNIGIIDRGSVSEIKEKTSANEFLNLFRNSFQEKTLHNLQISHATLDSSCKFMRSLDWLSIINCESKSTIILPKTLKKLRICNNLGSEFLEIPNTVKYLTLEELKDQLPTIPRSIEKMNIKHCLVFPEIENLWNLKYLSIEFYPTVLYLSLFNEVILLNVNKILNDIKSLPCLRSLALHFDSNSEEEEESDFGNDIVGLSSSIIKSSKQLEKFLLKGVAASDSSLINFLMDMSILDWLENLEIKIHSTCSIAEDASMLMTDVISSMHNVKCITINFANKTISNVTPDHRRMELLSI